MPKRPVKKAPAPTTQPPVHAAGLRHRLRSAFTRLHADVRDFTHRRPHHSFQLSRRRDYVRSLSLPKYWRFSGSVWTMLWRHKKIFIWLTALYTVLYAVLVGVMSQDAYTQISSSINAIGAQVVDGNVAGVSQGLALYITVLSNTMTSQADATKQVYVALLGLLLWLTVVWLLRGIMAGKSPRLRDGLYNSGAPILPTFLVLLVFVVQALPVAIAAIAYGAASASGLLAGGVETMLFWVVETLLVALSLYWMTSTFIALVVVTLPGMYPLQALKAAGELVLGRRLRVLWRILWLFLLIGIAWTVVVLPMIFFDSWLKSVWSGIQWLPLIPGLLLIMGSLTIVYSGAYIYTLYRRIVENDTSTSTH